MTAVITPIPSERVQGRTPYAPFRPPQPIDLWLDANEGPAVPTAWRRVTTHFVADDLRRYPWTGPAESRLAARLQCPPESVLLTAGGDREVRRHGAEARGREGLQRQQAYLVLHRRLPEQLGRMLLDGTMNRRREIA